MSVRGECRRTVGNGERSVTRLEKFVASANSTLSHPRRSSVNRSPDCWSNIEDLLFEKKLRQVESNFKADADEILLKMNKMLASNNLIFPRREISEVLNKIKDINEQIESRKNITGQSRRKLQSLINEKELKVRSENLEKQNKKCFSEENLASPSKVSIPVSEFKDDLTENILQTKEIINRGFQTARQLAQKFENMSENEKILNETVETKKNDFLIIESGLKSARENQTEFKGNLKTILDESLENKSRKEIKKKRKVFDKCTKQDSVEKNCSLLNVREKERKSSSLKFQRLPSLKIHGGLQTQKVYNIEIPPENEKHLFKQTNVAVHLISHPSISEETSERLERNLLESNYTDKGLGKATLCSNCGKMIRTPKVTVDPKEVDDILLQCNFNVFDNRIEKLAEKWSRGAVVQTERVDSEEIKKPVLRKNCGETNVKKVVDDKKIVSAKNPIKIRELCASLSRKYKERASGLRDDHEALKSIIRNLFERVDESRKFFGDLRHFSILTTSTKVHQLKTTKPVVVCLPDQTRCFQKQSKSKEDTSKNMNENEENLVKIIREIRKKPILEPTRNIENKKRKKSTTGLLLLEGGENIYVKKKVTNKKAGSNTKCVHSRSSSSSSSSSSSLSVLIVDPSKKNKSLKSDYESDFEKESLETSQNGDAILEPSEETKSRVCTESLKENKRYEQTSVVPVLPSFPDCSDSICVKHLPLPETRSNAIDASSETNFDKDHACAKLAVSSPPLDGNALSEISKSSQSLADGSCERKATMPTSQEFTDKSIVCLKNVMSILGNQIVKTQSLAEKLTSTSMKEVKNGNKLNCQNTSKTLEHQSPECESNTKDNANQTLQELKLLPSLSERKVLNAGTEISPQREDLLEKVSSLVQSSEGSVSSIAQSYQEGVEKTSVRRWRLDRKSRSDYDSKREPSRPKSYALSLVQDSPLRSNEFEESLSEGEISTNIHSYVDSNSTNSIGQVS